MEYVHVNHSSRLMANLKVRLPPSINSSVSSQEHLETWQSVLLGVLLVLVILATIFGNLLVCITILLYKSLQTKTNYFILSLAASDLLLGIVVLPFSSVITLQNSWPLGVVLCNIYIGCDVMLCTVSILNLFVISLERHFALSRPLDYARHLTGRRVTGLIGTIWLFSFAIAFIPIHLGLNTETGSVQNYANPTHCVFESNKIYVLLVAILTYFLPLIIMSAVYIRVFYIARCQVQQINILVQSTLRIMNPGKSRDPRLVSDSKATVTVASVMLAFVLCWLPYFTIFTTTPFVGKHTFPLSLQLLVLWLGYINSMLNPLLYAFHSTQFRKAFINALYARRYGVNV